MYFSLPVDNGKLSCGTSVAPMEEFVIAGPTCNARWVKMVESWSGNLISVRDTETISKLSDGARKLRAHGHVSFSALQLWPL